ncbi:MAG: hypothetical protein H6755_06665 [Candidatus Omnitrophica bacterium]|nr:hypothetical protein [Candidatus Omnitrophota bacterium]
MIFPLWGKLNQVEGEEMFFHKPKHVIFLIHGIGGDKTHFGYMSKALPKILNEKDPSTKYLVKSIEYDTGHDEKTPYEFAQDINLVIQRTTASGKFRKEDKISLIMHSQGGLVGAIWVMQSLMGSPGYSSPATIKHLNAFITLGAPFWGAKTAQWGSEIKALTNRLGVKVALPYGKRELEQMSFGSDLIFDFRMAMIDPQYQPYINHLRENVRFLNIVGVADLLNPLGIFVSGSDKYEDDGAVPLASARFNFLYIQSLKNSYDDDDLVLLEEVREVDMAPYVVVNAMHRSPLPELENFAGIAQIPKKCIRDKNCLHPTFPYLWNHILGNPVQQLDRNLGDFKTFLLDLNIRIEAEQYYHCNDIHLDFRDLDGKPINQSNIEIKKFFEFYAHGKKNSQKYPNHCRFYFTGTIKRVLPGRDEAVRIKIFAKGLKTRVVEMKLRESYSSFVDVNLIPAK